MPSTGPSWAQVKEANSYDAYRPSQRRQTRQWTTHARADLAKGLDRAVRGPECKSSLESSWQFDPYSAGDRTVEDGGDALRSLSSFKIPNENESVVS